MFHTSSSRIESHHHILPALEHIITLSGSLLHHHRHHLEFFFHSRFQCAVTVPLHCIVHISSSYSSSIRRTPLPPQAKEQVNETHPKRDGTGRQAYMI